MELYQINPNIRYAKEHLNFKGNEHFSKCYDCRIFYIKSASGYIELNDANYKFSNNYIIFLPPETEYRFVLDYENNTCVQVLNFDLTDRYFKNQNHLGTVVREEFDKNKVPQYILPQEFNKVIVKEDFFAIYEPLNECIREYIEKRWHYKEISASYLKQSLISLLRESNSLGDSNEITETILNYVHENYDNSSLKCQDIANKFNYHPYHINRLIKKTTGKALHQYLLYYRIRIAKDLLITTDLDVSTISWKVGFNSVSHFIKTFQEHSGKTPQRYRKSNNI